MPESLIKDLLHLPRVGTRALAVWARHLRVWLKGAVWSGVFGDLIEPVIYLFGLGYGLGAFVSEINGQSYIQYVAPGLLAMGVMWSASFENTYGSFTRMERQKTFSAIMMTPVSLEEVVAGELLFGATKSLVGSLMMLIVLGAMGLADFPGALWVIPLAALIGLSHAAIALTVTALSPSYDFFTYYFTIILTPVLLLSGAWFPVEQMHPLLQQASEILPLTHAVRAARIVLGGAPGTALFPSLLVLCLHTLFFFTLSANLIRRRLIT